MASSSRSSSCSAKSPLLLLQEVLTIIENDDSFAIPTKEAKSCLEIARSMAKILQQASPSSKEFSCWLVGKLENIVLKAKKRGSSVLNDERLWSMYHQLSISKSFQETWEKYLSSHNLKKEPMLYQHITDELFDLLIKEHVTSNFNLQGNVTQETDVPLSFEEENTVRYIGGYLVRKIRETSNDGVKAILSDLTADGSVTSAENLEHGQAWINAIDRGGLVKITTEAHRCFYAIESCIRRHLNVKKVSEMDNTFRSKLSDAILTDDDVLFYWCLAGQIEGDESADLCLRLLVEKYITVREFAFAKGVMELHKQQQKKSTGKSKAFRSTLQQSN